MVRRGENTVQTIGRERMTTGGLGEWPQSPVQEGTPPDGREGSKAKGRRLSSGGQTLHTTPLHTTPLHTSDVTGLAQAKQRGRLREGTGCTNCWTGQDKMRRDETRD